MDVDDDLPRPRITIYLLPIIYYLLSIIYYKEYYSHPKCAGFHQQNC